MKESIVERVTRRTTDKATWPPGPWQSEPDEKRWTDEATGLECFMKRGPTGSWCGYVGVPEGHPAFGLSYYKSDFDLADVISGKAMREVRVQHQINEIEVHGGLTYSGTSADRGAGKHWFGFDCAHAGDWNPKMDDIDDLGKMMHWNETNDYRTLEYVMEQTAALARQLAAIDPEIVIIPK